MIELMNTILAKIFAFTGSIGASVMYYHQMLVDKVGEQIAAGIYLCVVIIILGIFFKLFKVAFNILRYVIVPALVAGYIASTFFSVSFLAVVPIAGAAGSLIFLLKS